MRRLSGKLMLEIGRRRGKGGGERRGGERRGRERKERGRENRPSKDSSIAVKYLTNLLFPLNSLL